MLMMIGGDDVVDLGIALLRTKVMVASVGRMASMCGSDPFSLAMPTFIMPLLFRGGQSY
jgi:hypothetical protein